MTDLAAAYAHCETILRAEDHDAWLAALFASADTRPGLHALGAFALEVGRVRDRVRQAIAGEIRLQWWQDVVDGSRAAEATAHPVAAALLDTARRAALPAVLFGDMLDAHRMALYDEPPADMAALEARLVALRGVPVRLAARVLGGGPAAEPAADHAGVALGLADLLGELGRRDASRPAALLPIALLSRHGARREDAASRVATPEVKAALADLRVAARRHLAALRAARPNLGAVGPAVLVAALVEPRLARGERAADPFAPATASAPWRRQWRLWRAARNGGAL